MITQLPYHLLCLISNLLLKLIVLRIVPAPKSKILPDHYPVFVTKVKKLMIFIDVPAPAPHHITTKIDIHIHRFFKPAFISAMKSIQRHMICPFSKYLFTITNKHKPPRIGFRIDLGIIKFYLTNTNFLNPPVNNLALINKLRRDIIKISLAISLRPPQLRRLNIDL